MVLPFTGDKAYQVAGGQPFKVELDFSGMTTSESYPQALHGQGFTILCGACEQYINFRFDASTTDSKLDSRANTMNGVTNYSARDWVIGVKNVKSADDLAEAIFQGISGDSTSSEALVDSNHTLKIERDASGKIFISKDGPLLFSRKAQSPTRW